MSAARKAFEAHMKDIGCNSNYMSKFVGGEYIYAQGAWLSYLAGYRAGVEAAANVCNERAHLYPPPAIGRAEMGCEADVRALLQETDK